MAKGRRGEFGVHAVCLRNETARDDNVASGLTHSVLTQRLPKCLFENLLRDNFQTDTKLVSITNETLPL